MTKKITKTAGRPPAPIEDYFTKIVEPLSLGFSLSRSCKIAKVPYTTVRDYYNQNEDIRNRIDALLEDTNLHARAKLAGRVKGKGYDHKAIMDWLSNMDEDFSNKPQTQVNIAGNEMSIQFTTDDGETF